MTSATRAQLAAYFSISAALRFSVALPQAFLTPILVSKGLTFSEIAFIQSAYMLVGLVTEVPSGYFADVTSRKFAYVISIIVTGAAYAVVFTSEGLAAMAAAWAIYGLGQSLQSSTMEFHFVSALRSDPRRFTRFFVLERNIPLAASVGAALLATVVFPRVGAGLYAISLVGFVSCAVAGTWLLPSERHRERRESLRARASQVRVELMASVRSRPLMVLVWWIALTQIGFTSLYQFWQMAFLGSGVGPNLFGLLFVLFQCAGALGHWLFGRVAGRRHVLTATASCADGLAAVLFLVGDPAAVVITCLALGAVIVIHANAVEFEFQRCVPDAVMSSMASLMNALASAVSLLILGGAGIALDLTPPRQVLAGGVLLFALVMMGFALARTRIEAAAGRTVRVSR